MQALMALDTDLPLTAYWEQVTALCEEAGTTIYEVLSEAQSFFVDPAYAPAAVSLMNTSSEMFAAQMGGDERSFASDTVRREKELSRDEELEALRPFFSPEELEAIRESMQDDPPSLAYLVQTNYIILYDILDPDNVTVAQREARLMEVKRELYRFLDGLTEEELLDKTLAVRVEALFAQLAETYSDDQMRVEPRLEQIDGVGPDGLEILMGSM